MNKNFLSKIKRLSFLSIGVVGSFIITGIFWLYLASYIGTETYGQLGHYFAIIGLFSGITLLGAGNTINVLIAKNLKIQESFYFLVIICTIIGSIISFFIFFNFYIVLVIITTNLFGLYCAELTAKKEVKKYAIILISEKILMVLLSIGLYQYLALDGILLGTSLSYIPFSIFHLVKIFKTSKINFNVLNLRLKFILGNYSTDLVHTISGYTDRIIIAPIFGYLILGNYFLGIQILNVLGMVPSILFLYVLRDDAIGVKNKKLKFLVLILSIVMAISSIIISPIIIPQLFPGYLDAIPIIQILSIAIIPITISNIYTSQILALEKSKTTLIGSIIGLSCLILMLIILSKFFAVIGIAISIVISTAVEAIFLFLSYNSKWKSNQYLKLD